MESLFIALASAGLVFTWASSADLVSLYPVCGGARHYAMIAAQNAATVKTASLAPFGRREQGWQIYEPQVAAAIGTSCAPHTKRFAARLADWQAHNGLPATGAVDPKTLGALKHSWQHARPFIAEVGRGACPAAAADAHLADIGPREGWHGKKAKLDARALADLRRLVAAARAADPRIARNPQLLTVVSAFRSPAYDAAKCARGAACNGIAKARCSAHRTGTAVDLYIGAAPGHSPVSSDDANRLHQSKTPAYRWLVRNAGRFGFVNYVFEPWHWEWIGRPAPRHATRPDRRHLRALTQKQKPARETRRHRERPTATPCALWLCAPSSFARRACGPAVTLAPQRRKLCVTYLS